MVDFHPNYIACGGNRHPAAADWDESSGLLAFGSDRNIAIWDPLVYHHSLLSSFHAHSVDRIKIN